MKDVFISEEELPGAVAVMRVRVDYGEPRPSAVLPSPGHGNRLVIDIASSIGIVPAGKEEDKLGDTPKASAGTGPCTLSRQAPFP
jgi:hypothetical protein